MTVSAATRKELVGLCRRRRTRKSDFSPAMPTHWSPQQVRHPKTGEAFTDDSAWDFVAELLSSGHKIEVIDLEKPPNKKGYVLKCEGYGDENIYIKLQLGSGCVIGRSFHISIQNGKLQ